MPVIDITPAEAVFGLLLCQQWIAEQEARLREEFDPFLIGCDEAKENQALDICAGLRTAASLKRKLLNIPIPHDE